MGGRGRGGRRGKISNERELISPRGGWWKINMIRRNMKQMKIKERRRKKKKTENETEMKRRKRSGTRNEKEEETRKVKVIERKRKTKRRRRAIKDQGEEEWDVFCVFVQLCVHVCVCLPSLMPPSSLL